MLKSLRRDIFQNLWETYRAASDQLQQIETALHRRKVKKILIDHFAIIDLPGPQSGIPFLHQLFSFLGYQERGKDYLAEKQNDFLWLSELDSATSEVTKALPQVVIADFRLEEMPLEIKKIIEKYAYQASNLSMTHLQKLFQLALQGDKKAYQILAQTILQYLSGRDWPLPTTKEFCVVQEWNELLAWVLMFGRKPNHFTLSIHLLEHFNDLKHFLSFIENEVKLPINIQGGMIKGNKGLGIEQAATQGRKKIIATSDSNISLPTDFVEFVWRYALSEKRKPVLWQDYFTGFVAVHANHVIESLYEE